MCTAVLIGCDPRNSPPPPSTIWAHFIRGRYWSAQKDDISLWPPAFNWSPVNQDGDVTVRHKKQLPASYSFSNIIAHHRTVSFEHNRPSSDSFFEHHRPSSGREGSRVRTANNTGVWRSSGVRTLAILPQGNVVHGFVSRHDTLVGLLDEFQQLEEPAWNPHSGWKVWSL